MPSPRFHLPKLNWGGPSVVLTGEEARHCGQVLRKGAGDPIIVFDGEGAEATAEITALTAGRVDLKILERRDTPPPPVSISLIQAIPKGANAEWIIEKAVELGVNAVFPAVTERTVVRLDAGEAEKKLRKWRRVALEACKQCGQNWLPRIHAPAPFPTVLDALPAHDLKLIASLQPGSRPLKSVLAEPGTRNPELKTLCIAIGPEGDFTPAEYEAARAHAFLPITLGPLVLRVETAALYALAAAVHELR